MPRFGQETTAHSSPKWFTKSLRDFTVKHIIHITFERDPDNEIDLIGYLMVKKNDFRLVGMNEIGITLFDIYDQDTKPFVVVKSFAELEKYGVLSNIADDIRLLFLPSIDNPHQTFIDAQGKTTYLKRNENSWVAWTRDYKQQPQKITMGECSQIHKEIRYELGNDTFFEKAFIHYPQMGIHIEMEILKIDKRTVTDEKFIPKKVTP